MMKGLLLINGQWQERAKKFNVFNPYNGELIGEYSYATRDDAKLAIDSASQALPSWQKTLPKERARILKNIQRIISERREELAKLITLEQGKALSESLGEIDYALGFIEWYSEEAKRVYGTIAPSIKANQQCLSIYQSIGVVGIITPWNFPLAMLIRKVAPALATGCTAVIKASEETPFTAQEFVKICQEAGVPDGVLNLVMGDYEAIGNEICSADPVKMLTFTGSTRVGKLLMEACAKTVKKVCLELGGNAPFIVFADADLEKAVTGLVAMPIGFTFIQVSLMLL
jgi:succinate-semialdehyde dehydrogenase/glutarate-semialdehyde dehydrogenase